MMKTLKQTSAAVMLALAVLASGCAADEEMTTTTTTDGEDGELMTITVSAGSDATTRILYDDSKVGSPENDALTWQEGDKLIVIGKDDSYSYKGREDYTLVAADAGKKTGSFTGKAITGATKYNIAYLNTAIQVTSSGSIGYSPKTQIQAGDGNTSHLKDNLYLTTTSILTDLSNIQLAMMFTTIMKFDLSSVPAEVGTLKKLTWTTEGASSLQSMELAFSQNEGEKVTFSSSNRKLTAYLLFAPYDMAVKPNGKFTVTLEGDKTYYAETTVANGKSYEEGKRYTATIDGSASTMEWQEKVEPVVVSTTVPGSNNYYNGLKMQIGTWKADAPDTQILLGETTIAEGKASIPVDLSTYSGQPIWVCIPKVAKFFHTLTQDEVDAKRLTLPDKDGGSSLKAGLAAGGKLHTNNWIVALYMGVNKGGATGADATPIYWATGNLIATKTNPANSGTTDAAFHIATAAETVKEASTTSTYIAPTGIADSGSDGYAACALGAQWNKFGWGDATGLKTSTTDNDYAPSITTGSISGDVAYDIARAKLGGSWRLPTGGAGNTVSELAGFADTSNIFPPNGEDWTESGTYTGRTYTYTVTDANNITNTLKFPAAGNRNGVDVSDDLGTIGYYWGGTLYNQDFVWSFYVRQNEAAMTGIPRFYGFSVRPVTE